MKSRPVIQTLLRILVVTLGLVVSSDGVLPGLTITGNTFVYDAPDGQVTGIIRIPSGTGPFPPMLISHGKGGSASGFSLPHAGVFVNWGFVCIGPNYTHEGSAVNPPENEGYCPENSRRARTVSISLISNGTGPPLEVDHRAGKQCLYGLDARGLRPVHEWTGGFERFWNESFDRLAEYVRDLKQAR